MKVALYQKEAWIYLQWVQFWIIKFYLILNHESSNFKTYIYHRMIEDRDHNH